MEVYVVTDPELGWDCVIGVYDSLEEAIKACLSRANIDTNKWNNYINNYDSFDNGIIFQKTIQTKFEE